MRGKAFESVIDGCAARITPAYAGKRNIERGCKNGFEDHPRVCGEKSKYRGICALLPGSPPRMRGKELCPFTTMSAARITPAYAGKSLTIPKLYTRNRDHPRVCGEKQRGGLDAAQKLGSPPRMRGKVFLHAFKLKSDRITPAYAGKSRGCAQGQTRAQDHPRVCGEKEPHRPQATQDPGSPPRMRGKGHFNV